MENERTEDSATALTLVDVSARESILDYVASLEREFELLLLRGPLRSRVKSRGRH